VSIVLATLGPGGTERLAAFLAGRLVDAGARVTVLSYEDGSVEPFYALHRDVALRRLGLLRASRTLGERLAMNAVRVRRLRAELRAATPDVVVSFVDQTNVVCALALVGTGIPLVVSEESDPATAPLSRPWRVLRRISYPRARRIVVHATGASRHFTGTLASRVRVIPNPVEAGPTPLPGDAPGSGGRMVAMGRMSREKGFDTLIKAFARIAPDHPGWTLRIIGDGPLRTALETQAQALAAGRVEFPGLVRRPDEELRQGQLFVSSSRIEGFGNAICEAMACGIAVIATDCPVGPRDIVHDQVDGVLVPVDDVDEMCRAMGALMNDPGRREELGRNARASIARFAPQRVFEQWRRVLDEARR